MRDQSHDSGELPRKVEGLPVAGYRPQSPEAIASVNALKEMEEHVLRLLDEVAADTALKPDPRWFAIGRTAIEQGFMAVNRSIFKPGRVAISEHEKSAWLLERSDSSPAAPLYFRPRSHGEMWTPSIDEAMHFSRRRDAEGMAAAIAIGCRVAEHRWS